MRKGEKGTLIVKYGEWTPKDAPPPKDGDDPTRVYARPAFVFNAAQVDGYTLPGGTPCVDLTEALAHVDAFIEHTKATIRYGGARAYYRHPRSEQTTALTTGESDYIQIPERAQFIPTATATATECFESTRLHELIHWSGARHRLNRDYGKRFGDQAYAFEELVAEIGAAALCAHLAITNEPRPDHAQYIHHWLGILKQDTRAIFTAASAASKAIDYLYNLQPAQPALGDAELTILED